MQALARKHMGKTVDQILYDRLAKERAAPSMFASQEGAEALARVDIGRGTVSQWASAASLRRGFYDFAVFSSEDVKVLARFNMLGSAKPVLPLVAMSKRKREEFQCATKSVQRAHRAKVVQIQNSRLPSAPEPAAKPRKRRHA